MTEITIGAPLAASYVNPDGTLGRPVDISLLEGTFVKSVEPSGDTLTIVLQDANNEQMALTFAPALAAGSGAKTFVATAAYDDSTGVLSFTAYQGGTPSGIGAGDLIIFAAPSNIDDDQDITVDDTVNTRVDELYDLDDNVVQGHQLSPGRVYFILRDVRGSGQRYRLTLPLGLDQIIPVQTATVSVTNAQLKVIDDTPIELIPAPGAGKYIQILKLTTTHRGADRPTITGGFSGPSPAQINARAWLLYGFITDDTHTGPFSFVAQTDNGAPIISIVDGDRHFTGGLYSEDQTFIKVYGRQDLLDGKAFSVVFGMNSTQGAALSSHYTEAVFDELMATANDNTMTIEVEYYIHD